MVDYDPFSDAILDDPLPVYKRLRDESPIHWLEAYQAWALSRFEDVWQVGQQPENFLAGSAGLDLLDQDHAFSRQMHPVIEKQSAPIEPFVVLPVGCRLGNLPHAVLHSGRWTPVRRMANSG